MLKAKNTLLLKAIAMGALVTSGSMGAEQEDKRGKELNKAVREIEIASGALQGSHPNMDGTDRASRIRELLKGVEERKARRRDLLGQPRTFDLLKGGGVRDVLWHLDKADEFSDQGRSPVKVKALTLLNVAEWQLNQIFSHPHANHIEGLEWTYQPVPVATVQSREKGEAMDTASRIKELLDGVENRKAIRRNLLGQPRTFDLSVNDVRDVFGHLDKAHEYSDPRYPVKVQGLRLLNVRDWQLDQILSHPHANHIEGLDWTYEPAPIATVQSTGKEEVAEQAARDRQQINFIAVLRQIAERRDQPRNGFGLPLDERIRAEGEGHDAFRAPVASFAGELPGQADGPAPIRIEEPREEADQAVLAAALEDRGRARFALVLKQLIEKNHQNNQLPDQADEAPIHQHVLRQDDILGLNDENADPLEEVGADQPVLVAVEEDNAVHGEALEGADQPVPVAAVEDRGEEDEKREEGEEDGEIAGEDGPADPKAIAKLPDLKKRAAARRREAPLLAELDANFEEDAIEPLGELGDNPAWEGPEDKAGPIVPGWKMTLVQEDISNGIQPILQNLGSPPNTQAREASNLVKIYCRHIPGMVEAR